MPYYDSEVVRDTAATRWTDTITHLGGVDQSLLDGKHHPCPKCGGTDRFRYFDDGTGGAICNQCHNKDNGDGFSTIQWLTGDDFKTAVRRVAEYLGVKPSKKPPSKSRGRKQKANPEEHLSFRPWNDMLAALWCASRPPITPDALRAIDAHIARYRDQWTVLAYPVRKPSGNQIRGWVIQNITGGTLPVYHQNQPPTYVDKKTLPGTQPGFIGTQNGGATVIKTEGPSDLLSLISSGLADTEDAVCNVHGAKEDPSKMGGLAEYLTNKDVITVHDADEPGQLGAIGDDSRPGWATFAARHANTSRLVKLPYQIQKTKGKDLRDYFTEGHTREEFNNLVEAAEFIKSTTATAIEADDDPHRLARMNLQRYAALNSGAAIRYWRDEWYIWKANRYRIIPKDELSAKVNLSIKQEFDRLNIEQQQDSDNEEIKPAKKVTKTLVNNILDATKGMTVIPSHVELGTWIDDQAGIREPRKYMAMENGILDVDALLDDFDDVMLPHSPNWFSTIQLPYKFEPTTKCPQWEKFLAYNLEGDQDRIQVLQEWAGYCLLPDTGQQRFLVLEGEGANGKSVYFAALEAMLGVDNVAHVPLEVFGDRFSKTQTLSKLANIAPDAGEIEKQSEGNLKSFTAGERMMFDRKGIAPIETYPTARLMIGCNNRPRFGDKSEGIWRRMILIPFTVQVPAEKRIPNMDKPWWWEQSGELPGIMMWAVDGLARLREQGRFSDSKKSMKAIDDYRMENNPAMQFVMEHIEVDSQSVTVCAELYDRYKRWCTDNGYRALSNRSFGRELTRLHPTIGRVNKMNGGVRCYYYEGIRYADMVYQDENEAEFR